MDPVEDRVTDRSFGVDKITTPKDEEFCYECNMAFPTLNDCLIVHGERYCQECAMLIMTAKPSS